MSEAVLPEAADASRRARPSAGVALLSLSGGFLILLGCTVLSGWIGHKPLLVGLLPGLPPMVMNTALMFILCGLALVALARSRRHLLILAAAAVGILALLILAEHYFSLDLGIDLPAAHDWAQDGFPHPGRTARPTGLCFVLAASALILLSAGARPWFRRVAHLLGAVITLISLSSGFGYLLGLDALYTSYALRGMAIPTAAGLAVLGVTLFVAAMQRPAGERERGEDRRLVSIGTLLLVVVALITGLPMFLVVRSHIENTIAAGLRTSLDTEVQLIDTILSLRMQRAAIISNRPNTISTLRVLNRNPDDAAALSLVQATMDSFRPHGFSALRVTLSGGRIVAASGDFLTDPALIVPLDSAPGQELRWRDAFYLRGRYEIRDAGLLLATVDTEQELIQMAHAIASGKGLGDSGELQLCKRVDAFVRCFPSRRNAQPFEIPYALGDDPRLAVRAATGSSGMSHGRDEHGQRVIGVYAPIANYGLFVVLKMDTAELYGSLREDMELALGVSALVVFCGSLLFRVLVRPMAAKLVRAHEASQTEVRERERLHGFQRAVFDQAPDGILVADHEGRIVEANERMAVLFGYPREGLQGMRIEDLVPQRVRADHHHHRAAYQQEPSTRGMSRDRTLLGQRVDGSEFPIEVALAPMSTPEGRRVIAIVKDVSEARKAEQLIRYALKEKDLLLGEIHHRVKNNLQIVHSLLDMQANLTVDESAARALRDSQNRIQSMALIHQTLYQSHDFAKVDFGQFLDTLMSHLQSSYGRRDLSLSSRAENVRLAIDRAIPCGLIVNELVTNALKHAFPDNRSGHIVVEVRVLNHVDVEVAVRDDGVGIPETLDLNTLSSLGMQLVQVLTEQLHAELHIQHRDPTRIAFTFPLN